jgi:hypothetical protein
MRRVAGVRALAEERKVRFASVKAWGERRMAQLAAWSAPGVTDVEDYLAVDS